MWFNDTGTRLRGVVVSGDYGSPAAIDWTEAGLDKVEYSCEFQPLSSSEDVVQQQRTVTRWRLFLPAEADMTASDRWRFHEVDYEVEGDVERFRFEGSEDHVEAVLFKVTGG